MLKKLRSAAELPTATLKELSQIRCTWISPFLVKSGSVAYYGASLQRVMAPKVSNMSTPIDA